MLQQNFSTFKKGFLLFWKESWIEPKFNIPTSNLFCQKMAEPGLKSGKNELQTLQNPGTFAKTEL